MENNNFLISVILVEAILVGIYISLLHHIILTNYKPDILFIVHLKNIIYNCFCLMQYSGISVLGPKGKKIK